MVVPLELGYILMKPKMKVLFLEITMPHNCDVKNKFSEETYLRILILKSSGHQCIITPGFQRCKQQLFTDQSKLKI